MLKIVITTPENNRFEFERTLDPFIIGRSTKADVCVSDENLSRQHLEISFEKGDFFVKDLGSINGSFINGERIPANQKIPYSTFFPLLLGKLTVHLEIIENQDGPIPSRPKSEANMKATELTMTKTKTLARTDLSTKSAQTTVKAPLLSKNHLLIIFLVLIIFGVYYLESQSGSKVDYEETEGEYIEE